MRQSMTDHEPTMLSELFTDPSAGVETTQESAYADAVNGPYKREQAGPPTPAAGGPARLTTDRT